MADNNDIPPVPLPPDDVNAAPAVPPVEAAPTVPAAPAAAYGAPTTPPPVQPAYGSPTAYGQPAYAAAPAGPSQGLSITSMVLGIVGVLCSFAGFGFLIALAAVITGHLAQKRQPYARPFWLTGLITGYIGVAISVITILFFVVILVIGFTAAGVSSY